MSTSPIDRLLYPAANASELKPLGALLACSAVLGYLLYRWLLPKPIQGIPYNVEATNRLFGDIPSLLKEITGTEKTFVNWLLDQVRKHDSPLIQLFIRPLDRPVVVLSDFREAQDLLMRRRDFDRSVTMREFFYGIAPDHHIHEPTNATWKAHRRLLQDLMSPPFLHGVAGPALHANARHLVELWSHKAAVAGRRPFSATDDIYGAALDAVYGFAFGSGFPYSATRPNVERLEALSANEVAALRASGGDDVPIVFPQGERDDAVAATFAVSDALEDINGKPLPQWRWKLFTSRQPRVSQGKKIKDAYIRRELECAVERMNSPDADVRSAIDHMVQREKKLAEKDGREPDYLSKVMADEAYGFVIAGHETTSTTLLWGLKILADNQETQTRLRLTLQAAYPEAVQEKRDPSIQEITETPIPYLDAMMEEILRIAGTVPAVDRQALCDTTLLGHHIPKGTIVFCLGMGPDLISPGFKVDEKLRSESSRSAKEHGRDRSWNPEDIGLFRPERWLVPGAPGGKHEYEFDASAGPQLAFGLGTRGCFGKRLAYLEFRTLLTMLVWNFELQKCPEELSGYTATAVITHKPRQCYVRLRKVEF